MFQFLGLQENDLIEAVGPTAEEKAILDQASAEFTIDGKPGTPWREALQRIRLSSAS